MMRDDWEGKTAEQIAAYMREMVDEPTGKQVTFADVEEAIGENAAALVMGTMKAAAAENPLMESAIIAMSTTGLTLSPPTRQAMVDRLADAGNWPDAVRNSVKALGLKRLPRWQLEGRDKEPTRQTIESELVKDRFPTRYNRHIAAVIDSDTVTKEAIIAALRACADEWEAE